MKKNILSSIFLFFFVVAIDSQVNGQSIININGTVGSFGITSSEYVHNLDLQYHLDVGKPTYIDVEITYDTEKDWDLLFIYECDNNFSNLKQVMTLSGAGERSYRSVTPNGKLVVSFLSDSNTSGDKGYDGFSVMYYEVNESIPPDENIFEETGRASIGSVSGGANLKIVDYACKNLGALTLTEPDYNNSMILLESSTNSMLGLSYNKLAANGSFGFTAGGKIYHASDGYSFSTTENQNAFEIYSNGNVGINNPPINRGKVNIGMNGEPYEGYIEISDPGRDYEMKIFNAGGNIGSSWGGGISAHTKDNHYALCFVGDNRGTSTGSRGIIVFDGRMGNSSALDNQVVFEFCSGYGKRLTHIDGSGSFIVKKDIEAAGTIRASEIKVRATGNTADFVFSDSYELRDLQQVEDFIKEHKHLPDIPSSEEMEASGVNLGEMNKMLLQKIEELTLYVISLQKEKDSLRAELEARSNWQKELDILKREIIRIKNRSNL
jgi:hypothetical protein